MDERRHVDELDRSPAGHRLLAAALGGRRAEEDENGSQALATRGECVGADRADEAWVRRDRALEALLEQLEVGVEPGSGADGGERAHEAFLAVWSATMPPPRSFQPMSAKPARRIASPRSSGTGESADARREVAVGAAARQDTPGERHQPVEPEAEEGPQRATWARDLEARQPPARPQHPRELTEPRAEVLHVANAEPDRGGVEAFVLERQREHVAADPLDRRRLPPRPLEHPLGEVQAGHVAARLLCGHRQVAGPAAGVEHPVAGPDDARNRQAAPAAVEAPGHEAVHRVVDRRDPVEHRLDGGGGEHAGAHWPHRLTSVWSIPS